MLRDFKYIRPILVFSAGLLLLLMVLTVPEKRDGPPPSEIQNAYSNMTDAFARGDFSTVSHLFPKYSKWFAAYFAEPHATVIPGWMYGMSLYLGAESADMAVLVSSVSYMERALKVTGTAGVPRVDTVLAVEHIPAALRALAEVERKLGYHDSAILCFAAYLQHHPEDLQAVSLRMADCAMRKSAPDVDFAIATLDVALHAQRRPLWLPFLQPGWPAPSTVKTFQLEMLKGGYWMQTQRDGEAEAQFQDIIARYPGMEGLELAFLNLGHLALKREDEESALRLYDAATAGVSWNRTLQEANWHRARLLNEFHNRTAAIEGLRRMDRRDTDPDLRIAAKILYAELLWKERLKKRAVDELHAAIDLVHAYPDALASRYMSLDVMQSAIRSLSSDAPEDTEIIELQISLFDRLCGGLGEVGRQPCMWILADLHSSIAGKLASNPTTARTARERVQSHHLSAGDTFVALLAGNLQPAKELDAAYFAARSYQQGENFPAAKIYYQRFLRKAGTDSRLPEAHLQLGLVMQRLGIWSDALFQFDLLDREFTTRVQAYEAVLQIGVTYEKMGEIRNAIEAYKRIFNDHLHKPGPDGQWLPRFDPDSSVWRRATFALGRIYYEQGDYEKSLEQLETAQFRYKPQPGEADLEYNASLFYTASAYFAIGEYANALPLFRKVVDMDYKFDIDPDFHMAACFAIGDVNYRMKLYAQAIDGYQQALNRYPRVAMSPWASYQIGNCWRQLGDEAQAIKSYEKALFLTPTVGAGTGAEPPPGISPEYWGELIQWNKTFEEWKKNN